MARIQGRWGARSEKNCGDHEGKKIQIVGFIHRSHFYTTRELVNLDSRSIPKDKACVSTFGVLLRVKDERIGDVDLARKIAPVTESL